MNTYVMGEIATLLAIAVLAGILIGWCIKSLLAGRKEREVRTYVNRDMDDAMADVDQMRSALGRKDDQLKDAYHELQKMRGRDMSLKAGNTNQIDEINKLKNELAVARQSLDRNRTEFNTYRTDRQKEVQTLNNQLTKFQSGGPVHDERLTEASETISALRNATRENDRVIDSLRARIKEGESTVENLRTQLRNAETSTMKFESASKTTESTITKLNSSLTDITGERDKIKRDYEVTLANKNSEISRQQTRLDELAKVNSELKTKEHEIEKLTGQLQDNAKRSGQQIAELKQTIATKEAERAAYLKDQKRMQHELTSLQAESNKLQNSSKSELNSLKAQYQAANQELTSVRALKTQVENKSAEVVALNDMLRSVSGKRDELQTQLGTLETRLQRNSADQGQVTAAQAKLTELAKILKDRDSTIAKLHKDMDDVVDSRNRLGVEVGELQRVNETDQATLRNDSEQQLSQMVQALKDRDQSFDKLRQDMDSMTVSRDRLTTELHSLRTRGQELETFKTDMQTAVANRDSELQKRKLAYEKLQTEFSQLSTVRDDYESRIKSLQSEVQEQAAKLSEQEKRSQLEIGKLQPQLSDLRSKLSLADSENQKISSELSDAATLQLALTEKESVIQKLQVELQDTKLSSSGVDQNAHSKINSLTLALQDRDTELSRLNSTVTDNRLSTKKQQSEIKLLQQEIDTQSQLISGLEEQAENTLTLHKKIAAQSTEIEGLRAQLYQRTDASDQSSEVSALRAQLDQQTTARQQLESQLSAARSSQPVNAITSASPEYRELQQNAARLKNQLDARTAEVHKLQQESHRAPQTTNSSNRAATSTQSTSAQSTANTSSNASGASASAKPRLFVRPTSTSESTESLTGVGSNDQVKRAATYTRDGFRIKHPDGRDNLALLPGIGRNAEQELNKQGVSEFEQIALWGNREVTHFAERSGISSGKAERYNWPKLARDILQGTYRTEEHAD